jgi:hypothetical protein
MRAARLRSAAHAAPAASRDPAPQPLPAPFAVVDGEPVDAPMWPIHPVVWFQPELTPGIPRCSGLSIERQYKVPMPDFLHPDVAPACHPDTPDDTRDPLPPNLRQELPHGDLAPLGWDPRAVSVSSIFARNAARKEEGR